VYFLVFKKMEKCNKIFGGGGRGVICILFISKAAYIANCVLDILPVKGWGGESINGSYTHP